MDAARLALLALRASIDPQKPLAPGTVVVAPSSTVITVEAAARALAALPKPVSCKATAENGVLTIDCRPLDAGETEWRHYRSAKEFSGGHRGFMSHTIERYGPSDAHLVAAFGREERLLLPLQVAVDWHRDYMINHVNWRGDDVANKLCQDWPDYQEAKRLGAVALLSFGSPDPELRSFLEKSLRRD